MSKPVLNAEQVRAWKAGQDAANRRVWEEARAKTMDQKLVELEQLFEFAQTLGTWDQLKADAAPARERWVRLRRAFGY